MDIPFSLTLFGCTWTVELVDDLMTNQDLFGQTSFAQNKIRIDSALAIDRQWAILTHEVIHVVDGMLALGFDEVTVERLGNGLSQFVRQIVESRGD